MKRVGASRILGFVVVFSSITLFAGCGGGGGGGGFATGAGEEISTPVITFQPGDQTVPVDAEAVFTVTAIGKDLSYQWERSDDSGATWGLVSGATAASYSIAWAETGTASFRCTVTSTEGSVISDPAELTVVSVVFVDKDAAVGGDGTSWARAYASLQDAMEDPFDCEIWVAAGTYTPGNDRSDTFTLIANVAVYGGFTGKETCRQARDWETNVTILSGDIGRNEDYSDNCYHVVTGATDATLDGFTITAGNDDSPDNQAHGGGMLNYSSSPSVTNCTFSGNATSWIGGGMYNENSSPSVTGCTFSGNSADSAGGGMYNYVSSPSVTGCTFFGNTADQGGGMFNLFSSPNATNCTFSGNTADQGGGMFNLFSSPSATNCTFSGNSASSGGGGVYNFDNSNPTIRNSILWGDTASSGSQIYDYRDGFLTASSTTITYSCIQGGYAGDGNIGSDPLLDDDHLSEGYLTLREDSPCIDAGDSGAVPSGITTDLAGRPRISGSAVDMGAYEYQQ